MAGPYHGWTWLWLDLSMAIAFALDVEWTLSGQN